MSIGNFNTSGNLVINGATLVINGATIESDGSVIALPTTSESVGNITTGTIDLSTGNVFSDTPATGLTYVFSNPPAAGSAYGFTLKITPSATVTITWPASVDWPDATAPDAPAIGTTNVYSFYTQNSGATYYGFLAGAAMA
jgi:hypothetical protein